MTNDQAKIELIIFDLGNVVFRIDTSRIATRWAALSNHDVASLEARFPFDEVYEAFERGEVSADQFYNHVCASLPVKLSFEHFVEGWCGIFDDVFEDVRTLLPALKERAKLVALTNSNELHTRVWRTKYSDVLAIFDKVFVSSEIGFRKPEARAFEHVLRECGVANGAALFLDDSLKNIRGARELGIRSIHAETPAQAVEALSIAVLGAPPHIE